VSNKSENPRAALYTLGCRLNQAETAIIAGSLQQRGFEIVEFGAPAELTVINTCTVTEQADAKCRQAVRQSLKFNPDSFVSVVGCYSQMAVDTLRKINGVDLIVGNEHKMRLAELLEDNLIKKSVPAVIHSPKIGSQEFIIDTVGLYDNHTRANLKIQDGCSFSCSFCLTVKARGPARSRVFGDIIREAQILADRGYQEIVFTGVNIGTYQYGEKRFEDVLSEVGKIDGLKRIRISSIEPSTLNRDLIDRIADSGKICRHLHIPLQSGDDAILTQMRRRHTAKHFRDIVEYAVQRMPDIGIGSDLMVGFPGESPEQFAATRNLVTEIPVSYFHVFTYSDRPGTLSHRIRPKVNHQEKKDRMRLLTEIGERRKKLFYQSFIGRELDVLFEEEREGVWQGFSSNYMRIGAAAPDDLKNKLRRVKLQRLDEDYIFGELV
jgi:threonylcarbamoyladenosine tRNA methylthiotransferase MtaB